MPSSVHAELLSRLNDVFVAPGGAFKMLPLQMENQQRAQDRQCPDQQDVRDALRARCEIVMDCAPRNPRVQQEE